MKNTVSDHLEDLLQCHGISPTPCWSEIGFGWTGIVDSMLVKLLNAGWDKDLQQIKEKFGILRVYIGEATDYQVQIVAEAEMLSRTTCYTCGTDFARLRNCCGWLITLCAECFMNESTSRLGLPSKAT